MLLHSSVCPCFIALLHPVTIQACRLYSIDIIIERKLFCHGSTRNQEREWSSGVSTAAVLLLVCERPPVYMVFSCTNLLLSLFTANKGDNYVMSTFRRLEVGAAM